MHGFSSSSNSLNTSLGLAALAFGLLAVAPGAAFAADGLAAAPAARTWGAHSVARAGAATAIDAPAVVGTVSDSLGAPLANATILVAEVGRATTTNAEGKFELRGLPAGEYHLNVTRIGYAPGHVVVRVPPNGDDVVVRVRLKQTALRLSSVVVSASPTGTETDQLAQATVELSGLALAKSISSSVAATLSTEPGVSQRFGGPAASMPVIRGLTGDRILVLQDGERSGDLASSASDHAVAVDPLAAERIEVVRGPASLLYGSSALGGVVNVISNDIPTAVPSHLEGYLGAQTASATPGGAISGGFTTGLGARTAMTVQAGFRDQGSQRTGRAVTLEGTDSRNYNATLGFGYIGERLNLGLAARGYDFEYGLPSAAGDPEAGVRIDGRRTGLSARGGIQLGSVAIPYLRVEGTAQEYTHDEVEPDGAVGTTFELATQTLNARATTALGPMSGTIGLQGLFKQYSALGEEALTPAANSSSAGLFVYQELPLGGNEADHTTLLQFGARWDNYRIVSKTGAAKFGPGRTVDFGNASGSLGISVPVGEYVTLSGSMARAFRAPTVEELYSDAMHHAAGTYDKGNPDLEAEVSNGAEAILRVAASRVNAQVSVYVNRVDNFVTPDIVGDTIVDGELVPLNRFTQENAQLSGAEGSLEVQLGAHVVGNIMGDFVRASFRDDGSPLPFMPPARIGGGVRWEAGPYTMGADARHGFAQDRVTGGSVDVATGAYTVLNVHAGARWVAGNLIHQLTLRVDNLADERYFDSASRIKSFAASPGRDVSLVYQLYF